MIYLVANAIGLLVANALLENMSVDGSAFVIAVLVFTGVEVLVQPLITQIAIKRAHALVGSSALIGLIVTVAVSDGLDISGLLTWVLATVIVWAAALLAGLILPAIFVKRAAGEARR